MIKDRDVENEYILDTIHKIPGHLQFRAEKRRWKSFTRTKLKYTHQLVNRNRFRCVIFENLNNINRPKIYETRDLQLQDRA